MKRIEYLCYYDTPENKKSNRRYVLSAANVITYMIEVLADMEKYDIEVVSIAGSNNTRGCRGGVRWINHGVKLRDFYSLGKGGRLKNKIDFLVLKLLTFIYLLIKLRKGDSLLVYHSIYYMDIVKLLKKFKKINLILQVEEIYGDVMDNKKLRKKELDFFPLADSYVFPTSLLNNLVNRDLKPFAIIHGTYKIENDRENNKFVKQFKNENSNVVHCVYAGTLDPRKGGTMAAEASAYLPDNYHVHILGFGTDEEIARIKSYVDNISTNSKAKLSYDGVLSGEDYIQFLQCCKIGLCTQDPDAMFNSTSFPSKILSYLSNGLRVVTTDIPAVRESSVGGILYYYRKQRPEEIAQVIKKININDNYDSRTLVNGVAEKFRISFYKLFE